jgi:hypothetical protein
MEIGKEEKMLFWSIAAYLMINRAIITVVFPKDTILFWFTIFVGIRSSHSFHFAIPTTTTLTVWVREPS